MYWIISLSTEFLNSNYIPLPISYIQLKIKHNTTSKEKKTPKIQPLSKLLKQRIKTRKHNKKISNKLTTKLYM